MLPDGAPDRDRRPSAMPDVRPDIFRDISIVIEGRPPTLNARRHWRQIAHDNAVWKATAANVAADAVRRWERQHALRWRPPERVYLAVSFIVPQDRDRDWDNLISTIKPLVDGIVAVGVIGDDSNRVIVGIEFSIRHEPKRAATVFSFSEIVDDLDPVFP
jgi:Holliday junction resolvase RusA-like endonuclease